MTYIDRLEILLSSMLLSAEQARLKSSEPWSHVLTRRHCLSWLKQKVRERRFGIMLSEVMATYIRLLIADRGGEDAVALFERIYLSIARFRELSGAHAVSSRHDVMCALSKLSGLGMNTMVGDWSVSENEGALLFIPQVDWIESFSRLPSEDQVENQSSQMIECCGFYSNAPEMELIDTFYAHGIFLKKGTSEAEVRVNADTVLSAYLMLNINASDSSKIQYLLPSDLAIMTKYVTI